MESLDWRHKLLPVFALATLPLAVCARGGDVVPPGVDEEGCVVSVRDSVEDGARATAYEGCVVVARDSVADGVTAAVEDEAPRAAGGAADAENVPPGWLELPAYSLTGMRGTTPSTLGDLYQVTHWAVEDSAACRNYTLLYDPEMYASYWVAYPLYADQASGTGRYENWAFDPDVPQSKQTDLTHGAYGVRFASDNYAKNYYARGHQIANADRNGDRPMCEQTYYMTNLTPQIQNGFNGGIWAHLESAVRSLVSADTNAAAAESASAKPVPKKAAASDAKSTAADAGAADAVSSDTVYVVTGAAFRKRTDGTEAINSIVNARDGKTLPVPNYYWKALLKVKWGVAGCTEASAVGFWLPHRDLKGASWADFTVSVDQIEEWTGLDMFANLPDSLQAAAEANASWPAFVSF